MTATLDPARHYDIVHPYDVLQVRTDGNYNSDPIDLQGRSGSGVIAYLAGPPSAGTTSCILQESDDGATAWTQVPNSDLRNLTFATISGFKSVTSPLSSVQRIRFEIAKRKRFVRLRTSHSSGGAGLTVFSAYVSLGSRNVPPTIPVGVF